MIHGLLFVLKILIWILLGILGLLLGILLFVLFCAIRYQVDGCRRYGELALRIQVRFLLVGRFSLSHEHGQTDWALRILGFPLWKSSAAQEAFSDRNQPPAPESPGNTDPEPSRNTVPEHPGNADPDQSGGKTHSVPAEEKTAETKTDSPSAAPSEKSCTSPRAASQKAGEEKASPEKKGPTERIRSKLLALAGKVRFAFQSFCDKIKQTKDRFSWLFAKWEEIREVLEDPANQKSARLLTLQIKKILRHVLPRRGKGDLTFGLEDPYRMGQLLSLAAVLYPFTYNILTLHPVFDQNILEGEVHFRGRIRPGVLLCFLVRLLLDSNIRKWIGRLIRNRI